MASDNGQGPLIILLLGAMVVVAYLAFNYDDFKIDAVGGYTVLIIFSFLILIYWDRIKDLMP
jgi:hypothetical protein